MNIDQQIRAALGDAADSQRAPVPNLDGFISRGKARRRRRNLARACVGVAVTVLVGGVAYGTLRLDPGTGVQPAQSSHTTAPKTYRDNGGAVSPGRYRMLVGVDRAGVAINADLTFEEVWKGDNYPVLSDGRSYGAVAAYQPTALAAGTGCLNDKPNTHVDQSTRMLAEQLAQLPRSTVLVAPTAVRAFGRAAYHVRLRINPDCGANIYRVAMTLRGGHGISYSNSPRPVVIDFWVLYVAGAPVVVDTWHETSATSQLVRQIARTRESITFTTGG